MGGKNKQTSTSSVTIDPTVMKYATDNFDRAKGIADAPASPYEGQLGASADTGASQSALNSLLGYNAPTVSTAQNVSQDQISHYLNPYLDQVVGATQADMEHAREVAQNQNKGAVAARGAFGNSRRGIYEAAIDSDSQRNQGTVLGGLRATGFDNAVGYGMSDLARLLSADTANQGAAISSAGVRGNAATGLAGIQQAGAAGERQNQAMLYDEWLRQQNDPMVKQGMLNQALGSIPVPQTSTTNSTSPKGGLFGTGINVGWDLQKGFSFGTS